MKNQTSMKGGASTKRQPKIDQASKNISGQALMAVSSTSTSGPIGNASQSGARRKIVPASEKGGHN